MNMQIDLEGKRWNDVDWVYVARVIDQLWGVMNTVMINLKVL